MLKKTCSEEKLGVGSGHSSSTTTTSDELEGESNVYHDMTIDFDVEQYSM